MIKREMNRQDAKNAKIDSFLGVLGVLGVLGGWNFCAFEAVSTWFVALGTMS
ncbi:MAG TPA: hypothetical protein VL242_53640 [Sorangium sp.]|nr:hypothetical protein [Sorangium sp.]